VEVLMVLPDSASTSDLVGLFRQSLAGRILDCNDACAQMLGYASRDELLSGGFEYANASDFAAIIAALPDVGALSNIELALRKKGGGIAWVLQNLRVSGEEVEGAMFDVTEQRLGVQKLEYQAQHDSLTHLPNRTLVVDRMNVALARTQRHGGSVAVLLIDLDHFEVLNSAYGHGIGDRVLTAVADRLADCTRTEDAVGRFGSDEFIIALGDTLTEADVAVVAQRVLESVAAPLSIAGHDIRVTASIGVAMSPDDGNEPDALMQRAMTAAFGAKERGRNRYHFHQSELNSRALERTALIAGLRRALARGELELHYQPEVNVQTGRIECIEALLRWRHPDVGIIPAADFFSAAEQGQLDAAITEWVLLEAARQAKEWHAEGMRNLRVAVNISSSQFYDRDLTGKVKQAVLVSGLESGSFELEIAETTLSSTSRAAGIMEALRDIGVQLAIDDFGSGGCSFSDLKQMPVDTLKIAPTFVHNVTHRADDAAIVQAMITMAKGLNMRVVAEGVESKEQLSHLLQRRCTDMQGYFFGRPRPAAELADVLLMQQH
jgi:diguanylate cyclase (GGDEF)-like protein